MATKATPTANTVTNFPLMPDEGGVRLLTVTAVLACSNATAWRMAKAGILKTVKVSRGITLFNVGSIRAVLNGGA
jgi:hypothetical protein